MMTPRNCGATFSVYMLTGACQTLFNCGKSMEEDCPPKKREF